MSSTTTTTFAAVQEAFVTAAQANVNASVKVSRLWPGPDSVAQMVFFTDTEWTEYSDAVIKAGRRYRDEEYEANFEIWNLSNGRPQFDGAAAVDDAKAIYDAVEEVVIEADSAVRLVDGVKNVECGLVRVQPVTLDTGWGVVMSARLTVTARLT